MINVMASIHIKDGRMSEFLDIFRSNIPNVLAEKGCIEDLQAHMGAPHMMAYREKVTDLVKNVSLKILSEAEAG